jgi:hypothetical protein
LILNSKNHFNRESLAVLNKKKKSAHETHHILNISTCMLNFLAELCFSKRKAFTHFFPMMKISQKDKVIYCVHFR